MCRFCLYKACCLRRRIIQVYIIIIHLGKPYAVKRLMVKGFPCTRGTHEGQEDVRMRPHHTAEVTAGKCKESTGMSAELKLIEEINNSN